MWASVRRSSISPSRWHPDSFLLHLYPPLPPSAHHSAGVLDCALMLIAKLHVNSFKHSPEATVSLASPKATDCKVKCKWTPIWNLMQFVLYMKNTVLILAIMMLFVACKKEKPSNMVTEPTPIIIENDIISRQVDWMQQFQLRKWVHKTQKSGVLKFDLCSMIHLRGIWSGERWWF